MGESPSPFHPDLLFGICVSSVQRFESIARPGIQRVAPNASVLARFDQASIFEAYNDIIEAAADSAALVLIHDDLELRDTELERKLRDLFANPQVAIVGVVGGRNVTDMAWWHCEEKIGHAPDTFWEHRADIPDGDVDAVDGVFLALSPWAIRNLRFDTTRFRGFHGYDADICRQAKAAGKRVVVADIETFHHTASGYASGTHAWHEALYAWRLKWQSSTVVTRIGWRARRVVHGARAK